jgi:hypothetical protein
MRYVLKSQMAIHENKEDDSPFGFLGKGFDMFLV